MNLLANKFEVRVILAPDTRISQFFHLDRFGSSAFLQMTVVLIYLLLYSAIIYVYINM